MSTEKEVRAMFAAQDEARANEEWRRMQAASVVVVTDDDLYREDVEFAAVLVGNAGSLGFDELMAEARQVDDEQSQAFLWSVQHALDGSNGR